MRARAAEVRDQAAAIAWSAPTLGSGLWKHDDIRNNFYLASCLFAACCDRDARPPGDRVQGMALAVRVLTSVLSLQDADPDSPTYGHWPLGLGEAPETAPKNPLPAELMGCLLVWFERRYGAHMDETLAAAFERAVLRLHGGSYYRAPLRLFNHHEAKYTASKLLLGERCGDEALLEAGRRDLDATLKRVRALGMGEYGALPWFWHWIQAFVCVRDVVRDPGVRQAAGELLDELWMYRARHYLGGAWAGGRMRSLPADLPRDGNAAFDYVQFGDFALPAALPRFEYAGLLLYEAPAAARRAALERAAPEETKTAIAPAGEERETLHSYLYRARGYAVGGILERAREFDNEQHRWEVTLPPDAVPGANRLYFFPCGEGYAAGDPRHAADGGEALYRRGTAMTLYPGAAGGIAGVLPAGEWVFRGRSWYGLAGGVYLAVHTLGDCTAEAAAGRLDCRGAPGDHGFVVEAIDARAAAARLSLNTAGESPGGARALAAFADAMDRRRPHWSCGEEAGAWRAAYETLEGEALELTVSPGSSPVRTVNGERLSLADYAAGNR